MDNKIPRILADGRWQGYHGIGRFSQEILSRLAHTDVFTNGPKPLSLQNLFWQSYLLRRSSNYQIFFTPGFNAPMTSAIPFAITIHDLIHLHSVNRKNVLHKIFYECIVRPAIKNAFAVFTVSNYSKHAILNWTNVSADRIIHVGAGVSSNFTPIGPAMKPGYPYLLHIGNASKSHKNIEKLLCAFHQAKIDKAIKLILTGTLTKSTNDLILKLKIDQRIRIKNNLSERELAAYYRGALGLVFPSLYEGFGLPVLEAMASGIPVLTSNVTSLPEVAGDAAILVNPQSVDSIAAGIDDLINNNKLRKDLITKGLVQCKLFSWDKTAMRIQNVLKQCS